MKTRIKSENSLQKKLTTKTILKGNLSKAPVVKIPKTKFENALKLIKEKETKNIWMESCTRYVHAIHDKKHDVTKNINGRFLTEARLCLLKRDMTSLAKILSAVKPVTTQSQFEYLPSFLKYAAICLYYHHREDLLSDFLKGVCLRNDKDINHIDFYTALTTFPT